MLSSFISGKTPSALTLIEDRLNHPGNDLIQALVHYASSRPLRIHILCFENPTEKWNHVLKNNVHVHDCFSDHRGWNEDIRKNDLQQIYGEKGLFGVAQELIYCEEKPSIICIDSLVPIIFRHGLNKCYRDLHTLLMLAKQEEERLKQVVAVIHEDAVPNRRSALSQLRHLASTVLQVKQAAPSDPAKWGLLRLVHRKAGGKIIKQIEEYKVESDFSILCREKKSQPFEAVEEVDPTLLVQNLTTFKLTLKPQEEEARSQLVLPYTRQSKSDAQAGGREGGGKVFYEPDAADDWDDEDPDDDLDV